MTASTTPRSRRTPRTPRADVNLSWTATLVMLAVLGTLTVIMNVSGAQLGFGPGALLLAATMVVVGALVVVAVRLGMRARRAGQTSGTLPVLVALVLGGGFVLVGTLALGAHLLGFE